MRYLFTSRFNWFDLLCLSVMLALCAEYSPWWFFVIIPCAILSAIGEHRWS